MEELRSHKRDHEGTQRFAGEGATALPRPPGWTDMGRWHFDLSPGAEAPGRSWRPYRTAKETWGTAQSRKREENTLDSFFSPASNLLQCFLVASLLTQLGTCINPKRHRGKRVKVGPGPAHNVGRLWVRKCVLFRSNSYKPSNVPISQDKYWPIFLHWYIYNFSKSK